MFHDEQELNQAIDRLTIDVQPRSEHRNALRAKMLAAFEQADSSQVSPPNEGWILRLRSLTMNPKYRRIVIAAAILIAVLSGLGWWNANQGVAFADVVRSVQGLQGARFTVTTTGAVVGSGTVRFTIFGNRMRQEMTDGSICIIDFTEGKFLILMPQQKQAFLTNTDGLPDEMRNGARNWLAELRQNLVAGAAGVKNLGARQVAGRQTWGFRLASPEETTEVWVDRRTNLPVQVEITHPLQGATEVLKDFDFATPVDESLVSLTPPQGYAVLQTNVSAHDAGEQDAVELLRAYAEASDGQFPAALDLSSSGIGQVVQSLGAKKGWQWSMSMTGTVTRAMTFLHMVDNTRYVGANVRLGDADRPVFYYKPRNSSMYRVIYGDLSVRESTQEHLPAQPASAAWPRTAG